MENDICYLIEIKIDENGEKLYLYTKNVALHFPDMGRKFKHKRSAVRYCKNLSFKKHRIVKYNKICDEIIDTDPVNLSQKPIK